MEGLRKRAKMKLITLLLTAAAFMAGCGVYTACKNDCPSQPPVLPPGHTALSLAPVQVSTRWLTLQWRNDNAAVSRAYVLLRNGKDTIYNAAANTADTIVVRDSGLTPSTTYNYALYRIYQNQHWDSAAAQVHTLDTTKDNYQWTVTKFNGTNSVLSSVWGTSPKSVWVCGGVDSGSSGYNLLHYVNGQFIYYNLNWLGVYNGCYGTSDTDVYVSGKGVIAHYDGKQFNYYLFNGDSLPNLLNSVFTCLWETPDGTELYVGGDSGRIVHHKPNGQWEIQQAPTALQITSILGFGSNNIYASGGYSNISGVLLHYDGKSWNTVLQYPGPLQIGNITQVWGESEDSLYIIGGGVFHKKGGIWENRFVPPYYTEGISSEGWNNVFVCGDYAFFSKFDGDHWVNYNPPYPYLPGGILNKVLVVGGEVFIVGFGDNSALFIHGK